MNHLMKFAQLSFMIGLLCFTISCASDDDSNCTAPALEDNLIGTWSGVGKAQGVVFEGPETVVFNTDGTFTDNDILVSGSANGIPFTMKTWEVTGSTLRVTASNGQDFGSSTYEMVENECDFINLEIPGFNAFVELSRQ